MTELAVLLGCYLVGAVPFGLIVGKVTKGIDIRRFGSGNIGASNVLRTLGKGPALLVFVLDTAKGLAAVLACRAVFGDSGAAAWWVVAGGLASVIGHSFSVFLGFQGGKGVATSLGVIIGLNWIIAACALGLWIVVVAATRYISVASMVAAVSVPAQMILWKEMQAPTAFQVLACVAAALILIRHRSNLVRLVSGTEPRIGSRTPTAGSDRGGNSDG